MSYRFRFVVAISAALGFFSIPLPGQGQEGVEYLLRSETGLAGTFIDPVHKQPVRFDASTEDGVLTLRLDLYSQSVTLRYGQGEFHLNSSANAAREFSTLSDEERQILRRLTTHLDQEQGAQSTLDASILCMIRNLSSWPTGMPLSVSVDSTMKTVGEISVPMEEIREEHRRATEDFRVHLPGGEVGITATAITSFCSSIGKTRTACYPTSLKPYKEKCESALVGGTTCRGRCGTTCNGLCTEQRYTQDCHSHDRCADVYGVNHRYCNFIFSAAFDDCAKAPDCVDLPGVWTLTYKWASSTDKGTTSWNVNPNGKFTSGTGATGTWAATDMSATLTYSSGCKPIYTGTLAKNRLTASGTMKCTTKSESGTWSASKTNGVLPAASSTHSIYPAATLDDRGESSSQPD